MKILHIDSSINGINSVSRRLTAKLVESLRARRIVENVAYHDLAAQPLSHLSAELFTAQATHASERTAHQQAEVDASNNALNRFLEADVVVIGAPMYNFTISSQLKAWVDRIAVAGKTFQYTAEGPKGLAGGKKIIVISSRGGFYGEENKADHQEAYLRTAFEFLGITDIEYLRAEGVNISPQQREKSISDVEQQINVGLDPVLQGVSYEGSVY